MGEKQAERLRGKSRTCYNIVIIGWGQDSASPTTTPASGVGVCLATQREAPDWIHTGLTVGEKRLLELLQGRERVDPGGQIGKLQREGAWLRASKGGTFWFIRP